MTSRESGFWGAPTTQPTHPQRLGPPDLFVAVFETEVREEYELLMKQNRNSTISGQDIYITHRCQVRYSCKESSVSVGLCSLLFSFVPTPFLKPFVFSFKLRSSSIHHSRHHQTTTFFLHGPPDMVLHLRTLQSPRSFPPNFLTRSLLHKRRNPSKQQ